MKLKESFDKWLERIVEEAEEVCSKYRNAQRNRNLNM